MESFYEYLEGPGMFWKILTFRKVHGNLEDTGMF